MIAWKAACAILVASQLIDRVGAFRQLTTMKAVAPGLTTRKSVVKNALQAAVIAAGLAPTRSARAATLDLDGLRAYAEQAMVAGEFGLAEDALTQLLERGNPRDVVALSDRGNCKSAVGRFQEAVQDFEAALAINPNVPDVLIGRGVALEQLRDFEGAIRDYDAANEIVRRRSGKDDATCIANRANALAGLGRYDEARDGMRKAMKVGRRNEVVMPQQAEALLSYQLGEEALALQQLRALVNKYPAFTDARAAMAAVMYASGETAKGIEEVDIIVEEDMRYADDDWVRNYRRWPPAPAESLRKLMADKEAEAIVGEVRRNAADAAS